MNYKVDVVDSVFKSLKKIPQDFVTKILKRIDFLEIDPRHPGSIKLSCEENTYRTRVGKYRIIYQIFDEKVLVVVINVDHRKDVYR